MIDNNFKNLKSFVINLDDYKNNYDKQSSFLEDIGLYTERFSAINAIKNEHLEKKYSKYISNFAIYFTPKSVIGCALSHILCCKYIYDNYLYDNKYEYFLIMEDDAFPKYNKEDFLHKLNKNLQDIEILDPNWDIIQLHSDAFFPTENTYITHYMCGSSAAYLISRKGIIKSINEKIISHADFIQHNFITYTNTELKKNLFYTDEKNSLNRVYSDKYNFYKMSVEIKSKILEYLKLPLRGEKKYNNFLEFKLLKLPYFDKEYTANEIIDYLLLGFLVKKYYLKL